MGHHTCHFSILRFQARYRGAAYVLEECEGCGAFQLTSGASQERRTISADSPEFANVLAFLESVIKRAEQQSAA